MLKARVITALLLASGLFAVLFLLSAQGSSLVFAIIAALAAWEWAGLMKAGKGARSVYGVAMLLACLSVVWLDGQMMLWLLSAGFWLVVVPLWLFYRWPLSGLSFLGYVVGGILLLPAWAAMVELQARSPWWLIGVMALVAAADIGAYFAGRAFGRHKLAPSISPGKTWEGVAGGLVAVAIYAVVIGVVTGKLAGAGWLMLIAAAFLLVAVSILGDLFESMIKRQAGMKDSSQLLPGHGGILDRIDSLTAALPLAVLATLGAGL
jgi:phosphatidate cytidylyltransferase